jgi:hypothetical protein
MDVLKVHGFMAQSTCLCVQLQPFFSGHSYAPIVQQTGRISRNLERIHQELHSVVQEITPESNISPPTKSAARDSSLTPLGSLYRAIL